MLSWRKCCCTPSVAACPTNCNCDGTGVSVQFTTETQLNNGGTCGALLQSTHVVGTVTDANGTWKFFGLPADGANSSTSTSCYWPNPTAAQDLFGPHKAGVTYYTDPNDFVNPCVPAGTQTLIYRYTFTCLGDGTVNLGMYAPILNCSFDGLDYYDVFPTFGWGIVGNVVATPVCSGSTLTASFTFGNLSGGQGPPSTTASVSINLADNGLRICQFFSVTGCNGLPVEGMTLSISSFLVSRDTDASGHAVITVNGSPTQPFIADGAGRFDTISDTRTFVSGATTTLAMVVSTGLRCYAGCAWPVSETLHVSFLFAGARDFLWGGTNWVSTFSYAGHAYVCTLTPAGGYSLTEDGGSTVTGSVTFNSCFFPATTAFSLTLNSGTLEATLGGGSVTE